MPHDFDGIESDGSGFPIDPLIRTEDYEDGSSLFELIPHDLGDEKEDLLSDKDFYANLAADMDSAKLATLGISLSEEIDADIEARKDWENTNNIVLKYLGTSIEEFRKTPFLYACGAFDTTLLSSLVRGFSVARAELLPAEGPCKVHINGISTQQTEDAGERVKYWFNYYYTVFDKEYYPDTEQLLWYTLFFGSGFRKCYINGDTALPIGRFVKPFDFIVNPDTVSLLSSHRMTQRCYWDESYIRDNENSGDFIEGTLPDADSGMDDEKSKIKKTINKLDGLSKESMEKKSVYEYYEIHVMKDAYDIEPGIYKPETQKESKLHPYVITMCSENHKIASIKRGWLPNDKKFKRRQSFINYYMFRGFGIYGIGYAALSGTNAIALTSILRQTIDAGMLKNFPGGIRSRGVKSENNDKAIGPSEFLEIDTGGRPIQECLMLMPYGEPSQVLMQLRSELKSEVMDVINSTQNAIPDNSSNAPVGTTLALLEVEGKVQSTVLRSLHFSLGQEFQLMKELFAQSLPEEGYPFMVPGKEMAIMRQDFMDNINITPVSNPDTLTTSHRLVKAETQFKLASSNPELHDMREAYRRMYEAMNVENIDKLLKPAPKPQSLDAQTENLLLMQGQPVTVSWEQDDQSHNTVHEPFAMQMFPVNPGVFASTMMHVQVHKATKIVKSHPEIMQNPQMQQMFMKMDPHQLLIIPEIQNMISQEDAQKALEQQQKAKDAELQQVTPAQAMMAEVEQKREAARMKEEEVVLKSQTEAHKAQLRFESEKAKMETQRDIAETKAEVDLAIAGAKLNQHPRGIEHE